MVEHLWGFDHIGFFCRLPRLGRKAFSREEKRHVDNPVATFGGRGWIEAFLGVTNSFHGNEGNA